ncbi:MAG: SMP-30/gluconolactonase/LRE family protein [Opitutaceae bacterium]|nr:SMP-30/gluconolactonase/LRE family protein [Opitutaceae bacterium]
MNYSFLSSFFVGAAVLSGLLAQPRLAAQGTEVRADLSVLAGAVSPGAVDATGAAALFNGPAGVALDKNGNLYIADTGNGTIRKVTPAGAVTTLAGTAGQWGATGGTGAAARFATPLHLAVDDAGDVFVADSANAAIRKITAAGAVTTIDLSAANPVVNAPTGIVVSPDGQTVYFTDRGNNVVRRVVGTGPVTVFAGDPLRSGKADGQGTAARFFEPAGLARDASGNLYVADSRNHTIRKITPAGAVTTVAGMAEVPGATNASGLAAQFFQPRAVAVDAAGNLYVADTGNHAVRKIEAGTAAVTTYAGLLETSGSATGTGAAARFDFPAALTIATDGTLYVADARNNVVRKIAAGGVVTPFVGTAPGSTNGTGMAARFRGPRAIATDANGNAYVADTLNSTIRQITSTGVVTTFAGFAGTTGTTDGAAASARFNQPEGILATSDGAIVYVADTLNHTIRKISGGTVTTLAGEPGVQGDSNGTGVAAHFRHPQGLAFDRDGNLIVADTFNNLIRRVTPAGVVTTVVGSSTIWGVGGNDGSGLQVQFEHPTAVAVNSTGDIFVADGGNATIRKVTAGGAVTTVFGTKGNFWTADGSGADARFRRPTALAFDTAGNLLVADPDAETVRLITPAGVSLTVAGVGDSAGSMAGAGPVARLAAPQGVAVASDGTILIADTGNHIIRRGVVTWGTPPTITQQPTGLNGPPKALQIKVTSVSGPVRYRWQIQPRWGQWTDLTNDGTFAGVNTDTLSFPGGTSALNESQVRCVLDNGFSTLVYTNTAGLFFPGNNAVWITGNPGDKELVVAVVALAGAQNTTGLWGRSWGIADGVGNLAKFSGPRAAVIDAAGITYVVDCAGGTIRKVLADGTTTTLAGNADTKNGGGWGKVDGAGSVARFAGPQAIALAPDGNLLVADTENNILRRVTPTGVVTTVSDGAGAPYRFHRPQGVAVDTLGTIYVSDSDDFTVRKISPAGVLSLVAGSSLVSGSLDGTGAGARFGSPTALAVDAAGVLYVVDRANNVIRKITPAGVVTTFAGTAGTSGADDGVGAAARFNSPAGIAVDSRGMLYVADTGNNIIRLITPTARVLKIAGITSAGGGDVDGAGASAWFRAPWGVACDNHGNLVVCDTGNSRVRRVTTRLPAVGETVSFGVSTVGNPGGFQWQAQAPGTSTWTNLPNGGAYTTSSWGDGGSLGVVLAASHDGYLFRCHVTRPYDNTQIDSGAAVVAVGIAPTITTQPVAKTAAAGQGATFTVAATGTPLAFAYRWQRKPAGTSTTWANLADGAAYRGTGTATLTLTAVGGAMNGDQFRCVVDNYVASAATSAPATLTASGEAYVDFASWRAENAVAGDANADQTGSGVTNLARYAFGLAASGVVANPVSVTTTTGAGNRYLQVGFKRKTVASDVHYVIQASTDLLTWTTLKTIEPGSPVDVLEQDTVPVGSVPRRFLRVRVEPKL